MQVQKSMSSPHATAWGHDTPMLFKGGPQSQQAPLVGRPHPQSGRDALESSSDARVGPWLEAAKQFDLNTDFDVGAYLPHEELHLPDLMGIMKAQSAGKRTIQALGDKILLHRLLNNLGVPQMPMLLSMHGSVDKGEVERLVQNLELSGQEDAFDIVVKPTHLSSSAGTLILSKSAWRSQGYSAAKLTEHMEEYMLERAHETESAALQSLVPGFVVQPRYKSCIQDFGFPVEIRVVTLWGKTRLGIWWFGHESDGAKNWDRNAWIVPAAPGQSGSISMDGWQVLTASPSRNASYNATLHLILQAMPTMARAAENIARATGAPFLRSDFFVGSAKWGVRLNEVAYGSSIDLRRMANTALGYADDSNAIAQILHEGFKLSPRQSPEHFLTRLGAQGRAYEPAWWKFWGQQAPGMQVSELPGAGGTSVYSTRSPAAPSCGSFLQQGLCRPLLSATPAVLLPGSHKQPIGWATPRGNPGWQPPADPPAAPTPATPMPVLPGKLLTTEAGDMAMERPSLMEAARHFMERMTVNSHGEDFMERISWTAMLTPHSPPSSPLPPPPRPTSPARVMKASRTRTTTARDQTRVLAPESAAAASTLGSQLQSGMMSPAAPLRPPGGGSQPHAYPSSRSQSRANTRPPSRHGAGPTTPLTVSFANSCMTGAQAPAFGASPSFMQPWATQKFAGYNLSPREASLLSFRSLAS